MVNQEKLLAALRLSCLVPVFPLVPGTKCPAVNHGVYAATQDNDQITRWWSDNPEYGIGVALGSCLADANGEPWLDPNDHVRIISIDDDSAKHDKISAIDLFEAETGYKFRRQTTHFMSANGGCQYIFADPDCVFGNERHISNHLSLDVLSSGFSVFPPTTIYDHEDTGTGIYTWQDCEGLLEVGEVESAFRQWYLENKSPKKAQIESKTGFCCSDYLFPDEVLEGNGRNSEMLSMLRSLYAKGMSEDFVTASADMLNDAINVPPLDDGELNKVVNQAIYYGQDDDATKWLNGFEPEVFNKFLMYGCNKEIAPGVLRDLAVLFNEIEMDCFYDTEEIVPTMNQYFRAIGMKRMCVDDD